MVWIGGLHLLRNGKLPLKPLKPPNQTPIGAKLRMTFGSPRKPSSRKSYSMVGTSKEVNKGDPLFGATKGGHPTRKNPKVEKQTPNQDHLFGGSLRGKKANLRDKPWVAMTKNGKPKAQKTKSKPKSGTNIDGAEEPKSGGQPTGRLIKRSIRYLQVRHSSTRPSASRQTKLPFSDAVPSSRTAARSARKQ